MDSRIPTLFGGIGRDGGRGSPRFEFGNPFCVVGVGLSGPGTRLSNGGVCPTPLRLERNGEKPDPVGYPLKRETTGYKPENRGNRVHRFPPGFQDFGW